MNQPLGRCILILLASVFLFQTNANAERVFLPEITHPSFKATLTAAVLPVNRNALERISINTRTLESIPSREQGRGQLEIALLRSQNPRARLMIIIPGLGGSALTNTTLYLAEKIRALGDYHVVAIPNPVSAEYAIGASASGLPGFVPRDLAELRNTVLPGVISSLYGLGLDPADVSLLGYSLGAVYAANLGANLTSISGLNLSRVFLLNPPIDAVDSVERTTTLYDNGMATIPSERRTFVLGSLFGFATVQRIIDNPNTINRMLSELRLPEEELAWVVGRQFRYSLRDMIVASQRVNELGVLSQPDARFSDSPRAQEALQYSFRSYVDTFLRQTLPRSMAEWSVDRILNEGSLLRLQNRFRTDSRFVLIHAEDDFLFRPRDMNWIQANFPRRAFILNSGGHLGYFWAPTFHSLLTSLL
jgi:pimeloyl-ACP methyl ester carboxylesterase